MDLYCKVVHLRGSELIVGNATYKLPNDGILRDVKEEHAERLLQGSGWQRLRTETPKQETPPEPDAVEEEEGESEEEDALHAGDERKDWDEGEQ